MCKKSMVPQMHADAATQHSHDAGDAKLQMLAAPIDLDQSPADCSILHLLARCPSVPCWNPGP